MSRAVMFRFGLLLLATLSALHSAPVFEPLQGFMRSPSDLRGGLVPGGDGNFYGISAYGGAFNEGSFFRMTPAGQVTLLASFGEGTAPYPVGGLATAADGGFYSVTWFGGIFHLTLDGSFTKIADLDYATTGWKSAAPLVQASDGNLYGTTTEGGAGNQGAIFRVTPDGGVQTLVTLDSTTGIQSAAALVQGADGLLHGVTGRGGSSNCGTIYTLTLEGAFQVIHDFSYGEGWGASVPLLPTPDGSYYGSLPGDWLRQGGTLFKVTPEGEFVSLHSFDLATSAYPAGPLVRTLDGSLYGITAGGGTAGRGTVFRLNAGGVFTVLHSFDPESDAGSEPQTGLVRGADGNLYGTTSISGPGRSGGAAFRITPVGNLTFLATFGSAGQFEPNGALVQDSQGNFYGTSNSGGANDDGTIFRISPDHTITTIHEFDEVTGNGPTTGLVTGRDGNFYGTSQSSTNGAKFYRLTPAGKFSILSDLSVSTPAIMSPGAPVLGKDGNFYAYASTDQPGIWRPCIIRLSSRGRADILSVFGPNDGYYPEGQLAQGADGIFRGVTSSGGTAQSGTVFTFSPREGITTVASYTGSYGTQPRAGLTAAPAGEFYGVGNWAINKLTTDNRIENIATFTGSDRGSPDSKLLLAADGNYYGTTSQGGSKGLGSVFRVTPTGEFTLLHSFSSTDGGAPSGGLMQAADGHIYGTTTRGGTTSDGRSAGGGEFFRIRLGAISTPEDATAITWNGATLHGSVDPGGFATTVSFQYGTDPELKRSTTIKVGDVPAGNAASISAAISRIQPNRTYYFRIITRNAENPVPQVGKIRSFTTARRPTLRELLGLGVR